MAKNEYYYGLGRRKSSTARVRLFGGTGAITVNGKTGDEYFTNKTMQHRLLEPLRLLDKASSFDISVVVTGGGLSSQVDAIKLGVAKALTEVDEATRTTLKKAGLLKRDSREKERKKYGLKRARKAEQFTKR